MAAQDAELQLKVSLDLAFFKQQLAGLGQAAAGTPLKLQVQFDRRSVQNELNALQTNIRRRTYRLNVETNLSAEIAKADTLARKLTELSGKVRAATGGAFARGPQGAAGLERFMREQGLTGRAFGVQQSQERIARQAVLSRLEKGSLSKGGYNIAGLEKIIRDLGGTPTGGRKDLAAQAKKLVEEADGIADAVFEGLKDLQMKLRPIRGQAQTSAARSMPNLNEMLDRMANLTSNPRAAQRMLRMMPESRVTTDLVGAANRQAAFQQQFPQGFTLPGFNAPKAFDPLLKAIAKDFSDYARTVNASDPWIGRIGNGISEIVAKAAASPQAQKLLPAAGQTSASRMTRRMFEGAPAIQAPQIGMEKAPLSRAAEYLINKARRALDLPIGPASPYAPSPFSGAATTPPRSFFRFGQGPQLPGAPIQAALPPAGTTTNYGGGGFFGYGGVRGTGGGGAGGGGGGRGGALAFPGGNMGPSTPLPRNYLEIGKIIKGIDPILQRSSVPFSGAIRELGTEFGFAIKQVLLFGTAYKALAFFMDLPAQALRASTALQSFNNQLNAITGGAPQAARSMEFINATVERFNIPLQSAREGFLRLYASMSPAGMNAGMIENLFIGISQASATLGLSADQVDRVTYAFSQMASKGKVMSEEVTGQLGDVIPGALSLMSDAAGMSMAEFKQAMEDGLVSGKAMEQLFTNLTIVLEQRFGKGAAGAAQTLQGQLNDLATSTTRLYEAFEPIVNSIAGVVLPALSAGLADAQSAVAAFGMKIEGINPATNLLSENAKNIYRNLGIVADTASSLISIVQSLGGIFNTLGSILSGTLQLFNAIVGNPVGEFFVKLAVNIGLATAAINLLVAQGIVRAIAKFALMVGNIQLTIGALKTLITTSRAAKIAMGGIVAGSIMVGLEMLVTHISKVREETEKLQKAAIATADALKQMSYQQLVAEERSAQSRISKLEQLQAAGGGGLRVARPTKEQEAMARELGLPISGRGGQRAIDLTRAEGLRRQLLEQLPQIRGEMKGRFDGPATAATITPIDLTAGEADSKAKGQGARKSLDQLVNADILKLTELEKANIKLAKARTEAMAPDTAQAERMLDYYVKFRNNLVDIQAIQAQLQIIENNRAQYIQLGFTQIEIDERAAELRNQLAIATVDLSTTEQEYRNRAKEDAADEAQEMEKRIDQQRELNRLIEDAAIASGAISQRQAGVIQQRRGFEDQLSRARELGATPEQIVSLQQLQASMPEAGSLQEKIQALRQEFEQLANWEYQAAEGAMAVGQALGEAMTTGVAGMISGTTTAKEVFANFLQSVGQALSQAASQMIATYIAIGIAKAFAGLSGGSGFKFSGQGPVALPGAMNPMGAMDVAGNYAPNFTFANGGIAPGGFRAFANGGVVSGPTLGLVGEGKYNEAVVPLPDGKSIPVQLGGRSARDMMGNNAPGMPQAPSLNMKFETTNINGVEYVSREQLEQAMASTRRAASREGAAQGSQLALSKLKNSPTTRRQLGF